MKKVSVLIATYNQKTLEKAVKSALGNDIVICDDGGNNNALEIARKYKTKYVWQPDEGMRLAKNWNNGIKLAEGDYCFFISGDTYLDKNTLELLRKHADENSVLNTVRIYVDEKGKEIGKDWRFNEDFFKKEEVVEINDDAPFWSITGNGLFVPTYWAKKIMWDERFVGYGRDDYKFAFDLWKEGLRFKILPQARIYHIGFQKNIPDNPNNVKLLKQAIEEYEKNYH